MGIETFPEIENFQKLPKQVIVKSGEPRFHAADGARLHGIVINNCGHAICDVHVNIVIFNERKIPVFNTSIKPDPESLPQGSVASFNFQLKDFQGPISDYHLYTNWKFDDA